MSTGPKPRAGAGLVGDEARERARAVARRDGQAELVAGLLVGVAEDRVSATPRARALAAVRSPTSIASWRRCSHASW